MYSLKSLLLTGNLKIQNTIAPELLTKLGCIMPSGSKAVEVKADQLPSQPWPL
jgi:hypothetical protein